MKSQKKYRLGIDLGGTKIEGVVLSGNNKILARKRTRTPSGSNQEKSYQAIISALVQLINQLENETKSLTDTGIGTPGTISSRTGLIKNSNTVCLNGKPLQQDIEQALGREIRIANDANCFTLSESRDGAGAPYSTVFGIIMGTGVGGGIVCNKKIQTGRMGIAGEWGHNPLIENGPDCYCGRKGCIETLLSGPALTAAHVRNGGLAIEPQAIIEQAAQGDVIAMETMENFVAYFGRAVASVINILDPDAIVLGGGLSNIELLYDRGRKAIEPHIFSDDFTTPVLRNHHGDSSGVLGAACLWD